MAFAYDVWHATAYGRLYQGAENWSMGFWLGKVDGDAGEPTEAYANAVHNRVKTFFGNGFALISWAAVLDGVKLQKWNADGTLDTAATRFSGGIAAQAGGSQRNVVPQLALAISFRGNVPRGPGANGRMYVPCFNNIPTVSGNIEQNDVNAIITPAATMFTSINQDLVPSGNNLILASKGGTNPVKPPINVLVTQLRVGNVVDTIQRRRNGLHENYTTAGVAAGA
jgi:hypothetical protein